MFQTIYPKIDLSAAVDIKCFEYVMSVGTGIWKEVIHYFQLTSQSWKWLIKNWAQFLITFIGHKLLHNVSIDYKWQESQYYAEIIF